MANEASILNNPTSIPEAVSTGYQRQNVNIVAARVGMDESVVVGGARTTKRHSLRIMRLLLCITQNGIE